jgi:hypothetical protein
MRRGSVFARIPNRPTGAPSQSGGKPPLMLSAAGRTEAAAAAKAAAEREEAKKREVDALAAKQAEEFAQQTLAAAKAANDALRVREAQDAEAEAKHRAEQAAALLRAQELMAEAAEQQAEAAKKIRILARSNSQVKMMQTHIYVPESKSEAATKIQALYRGASVRLARAVAAGDDADEDADVLYERALAAAAEAATASSDSDGVDSPSSAHQGGGELIPGAAQAMENAMEEANTERLLASAKTAKIIFDFTAQEGDEEQLTVESGTVVKVLEEFEDGWSQVAPQDGSNAIGMVPSAYYSIIG